MASKEYRETHKAEIRAYSQSHKTEINARSTAYNLAHREEQRTYAKAYSKANREKKRAREKVYEQAHREEKRAYLKAYGKTHREEQRVRSNTRRARERNAQGTHTAQDVQAQYTRQKGRCYYAACGHSKLGKAYHVDHVIPLSRGGSNGPENLVIACPPCNIRKNNKLLHEWVECGMLL